MADSDEATIVRFYNDFAADYHLVYGGKWETAVGVKPRRLMT